MKKPIIIALIVAASLVLAGCITVGTALVLGGTFEDSSREVTHTVSGDIRYVAVSVGAADVRILPSEDGTCSAVCDETDRLRYELTLTDGYLRLTESDDLRWYDFIGIHIGRARTVTLYLPRQSYMELDIRAGSGDIACTDKSVVFEKATLRASGGSIAFSGSVVDTLTAEASSGSLSLSDLSPQVLHAKSSSGSISLSALTVNALEVRSSSGRISLSDLTASTLKATANSGRIELAYARAAEVSLKASSGAVKLRDTLASATMRIETSSGNIQLEACDAAELTLAATSGSIKGTLLSEKLFDPRSDSGSIDCPAPVKDGGLCTVRTSSGDIRLEIQG